MLDAYSGHTPFRPSRRRRQLEESIRRIHEAYEASISAAPGEDRDRLVAEMFGETAEPEAELAQLETDLRIEKAGFWSVEIPDTPEWWQRNPWNSGRTLTHRGVVVADRLIRDERRATVKWWVEAVTQVGTTIIGVIGALIALWSMR